VAFLPLESYSVLHNYRSSIETREKGHASTSIIHSESSPPNEIATEDTVALLQTGAEVPIQDYVEDDRNALPPEYNEVFRNATDSEAASGVSSQAHSFRGFFWVN